MRWNKETLAEQASRIAADYDAAFANRGDGTPTDPLEYHLYHLALYWRRLLAFSQEFQKDPDGMMDGSFGACILMGSEHAHRTIGSDSPIFTLWQEYWWRTSILLHKRPTTMELIDTAHASFEACLSKLQYDPLKHSTQLPTSD